MSDEPMNITEGIRCALARHDAGDTWDVDSEDVTRLLAAYDKLTAPAQGRQEQLARYQGALIEISELPDVRAADIAHRALWVRAHTSTEPPAQRTGMPDRADEDKVKDLIRLHFTEKNQKAVLRTVWKDGIGIDRPSYAMMNFADDLVAWVLSTPSTEGNTP
jgi:hypothetical protein